MEIMSKQEMLGLKQDILEQIRELSHLVASEKSRKRYMKSAEVRKMLGGISNGTLQTLRSIGLPFKKVGGTIFYDYDKLVKFIDEYEGEPV